MFSATKNKIGQASAKARSVVGKVAEPGRVPFLKLRDRAISARSADPERTPGRRPERAE